MMLVSPQSPQVVLRRLIRAPVAKVFAAWSDPATLAVFMRPAACGFDQLSEVQVDFRVGGAFRIVMKTAERQIPHTGVYQVIRPDEQLVFTWVSQYAGEDSVVTIDFRAVGEATELVLRHRRLPNEAEGLNHTSGWSDILGKLDQQLAGPASAAADGFRMDLPIQAPASAIYAALTEARGLRGWWTTTCDIGTGVGALCTFRFGTTAKVMRIEALTPEVQVRWRCIEAHLRCPGITREDEWEGTAISFTLEPQSSTSTLLRFAHIGLVPELECHGVCTAGWRQFLGSLKRFVETGTGTPY